MTLQITNLTPANASLLSSDWQTARKVAIEFDLEVDADHLPSVRIKHGPDPHAWPIIFDGGKFAPLFALDSTIDSVGDVHTFSIVPRGGWWKGFSLMPGQVVVATRTFTPASAIAQATAANMNVNVTATTAIAAIAAATAAAPGVGVVPAVAAAAATAADPTAINVNPVSVVGTVSADETSNTASLVLPAHVSGDLIVIFGGDSQTAISGISDTASYDWFELENQAEGSDDASFWYAIADSTASTVTVTWTATAANGAAGAIIYRNARAVLGRDLNPIANSDNAVSTLVSAVFEDVGLENRGLVAFYANRTGASATVISTAPPGFTERVNHTPSGDASLKILMYDRITADRGAAETATLIMTTTDHEMMAMGLEIVRSDPADPTIDGNLVGANGIGLFVPESAADFTQLGIAAPDSLWLVQEASGNLADTIASEALSPVSTPVFQQGITAWNRDSVFANGAADASANTGGAYDIGASQSVAMLVYAFSIDAANRSIMHLTPSASPNDFNLVIAGGSSGQLRLRFAGNTVNGSADHTAGVLTRPILMVLDQNAGTIKAHSDLEEVTGTFSASALTGSSLGFMANLLAGTNVGVQLAAIWYGANAEGLDKNTITALGGRVTY